MTLIYNWRILYALHIVRCLGPSFSSKVILVILFELKVEVDYDILTNFDYLIGLKSDPHYLVAGWGTADWDEWMNPCYLSKPKR